MSGKASSSQATSGLSGSGALSHAYILYPPLRCNIAGSRGLFYDDGTKLLLCPTSDRVFSWKTSPFDPSVDPASDAISEGPIISIRYSLDTKIIAIQRSNHEVQFWHRESGETFYQKCRPESGSILGFFWTDCQSCDIVFVKTSGLDLYEYKHDLKSLQLVETKKLNVSWFVYTHESRLVLLASGMQCKTFNGFQLSSIENVRLPKFEMVMAKSEAINKPVLAPEDVYITTMYGRIYCLQVDKAAMVLNLYRLYRDAVLQQGSLPIYSSKIAVSVVDNVLVVHQVDAKVIILYDIFADSRAPVSAPLPLLFRGLPRSCSSVYQSSGRFNESSGANILNNQEIITYRDEWVFLVPDLICDTANNLLWKIHLDLEAISASSSDVPSVLEFLQRRKLEANMAKQLCLALTRTIILERRPVVMVARAIHILVTSYSQLIKIGGHTKEIKGTTVGSLPPPGNPIPSGGVSLTGADASGKTSVQESASNVGSGSHRTNSALSSSDCEQNDGFETHEIHPSEDLASAKGKGKGENSANTETMQSSSKSVLHGTQLTSPVISPEELYSFIFVPVDEELVEDPSYLASIIVEFLHSANLEKVKVQPNLYVLLMQLLARDDRYAELELFVINKILEPSKEVALQLLESGRQNRQTRKLGLDMLRQLGLHHDYVLSLMQDGYYLEALRYVRKYRVDTVRPSLFLEAAFASNNSQHLAAVLRFYSELIPGFKTSAEHNRYYHILDELNSSISA